MISGGDFNLVSFLEMDQLKVLANELLKIHRKLSHVEEFTFAYRGRLYTLNTKTAYKWIATDQDGTVKIFKGEPEKNYLKNIPQQGCSFGFWAERKPLNPRIINLGKKGLRLDDEIWKNSLMEIIKV